MADTDPAEPTPAPPSAGGETAAEKPAGIKAWIAEKWTNAEEQWQFLGGRLERKRLYAKVILVHLRYTFAYLAFGFLVSAPLNLSMSAGSGWTQAVGKCLTLGIVFALPSLLLYPFSLVDWGEMRIPEFKNMELALTRWACYLAAGFLGLAGIATLLRPLPMFKEGTLYWIVWACDWKIAWLNLVLMFFAFLRVKFHTVLFREFYTIKPGDDLVLLALGDRGEGDEKGEGEQGEGAQGEGAQGEGAQGEGETEDEDEDDSESEHEHEHEHERSERESGSDSEDAPKT